MRGAIGHARCNRRSCECHCFAHGDLRRDFGAGVWPRHDLARCILAGRLGLSAGTHCHFRRRQHQALRGTGNGPSQNQSQHPQAGKRYCDLRPLQREPQSLIYRHDLAQYRDWLRRQFLVDFSPLCRACVHIAKRRDRAGRGLSRTKIWGQIFALQSQGPALDLKSISPRRFHLGRRRARLQPAGFLMPPRGAITRRLFLGHTLASVLALPARAELPSPLDGFRVLEAREGNLSLLPEPAAPTAVCSYNGEVPGPLLRFKKGDDVKVRLVNKLAQPASLNWHGVRIVNAMDGVAGLTQEPVPPGGSFDYRFTPPDSGLFWYHPQVLPFAREQQGRGLYGIMIVDEEAPPWADRDMLVVLDDWLLDEKGQITGFNPGAGRIGALVTVNSRAVSVAETLPPSSRLRLRIVSVADTRLMLIAFNGVTPLILAVDGQRGEPFEPVRRTIPLWPGARFDVMFDLPADVGADANVALLGDNEPDRVLLRFKTGGDQRASLPAIASLAQNPLLPKEIKLQASRKVDISSEAISSTEIGPMP